MFFYALRYAGSKQIIFRRSFPELERSVIMEWLKWIPEEKATYNATAHRAYFNNGSIVEFAHMDSDEATIKYKSAEYDVIRFEEASEFSPYQLEYMPSRCRGANKFPKQVKYSTNPGGPGHKYLKKLFRMGEKPPLTVFSEYIGIHPVSKEPLYEKRVFIPALVYENPAIMRDDPDYITRMMQLPEKEREMLLSGSWDIADDCAFPEFNVNIHVVKPFPIPDHWKRWRSVDNGYDDPFAWYWYAVSEDGIVYVYREYTRDPEIQKEKVLYSDQAAKVKELSRHVDVATGQEVEENISYTVAGHDAYNTYNGRDVQGKTLIDHYLQGGVTGFVKAITDRRLRKAVIHEYLKPMDDPFGPPGSKRAKVQIFNTCRKLVETLPEQLIDPDDPEKYSDSERNDHWVDSFGYGLISYHAAKTRPMKEAENPIIKHKREYWRKMQDF